MRYFDHNATTPLSGVARQAWLEAVDQFAGNPSSPHRLGQRAEAALQRARESLASHLGCVAPDIVWTSGATESNNMIFHHLGRSGGGEGEVWVSAIEHPCVLAAANRYFPGRVRHIPVHARGIIEMDWFSDALKISRPRLVAVMAANNETGVLQPWREALEWCRAKEIPFFCDAAQWLGKLPASGLGMADYVSGCAHKFGGPKGVGFLKCPGPTAPLLLGGNQEDGRRAGTENVAGVLSMTAALEQRASLIAAGEQEIRVGWRETFERAVIEGLPGAEVVGAGAPRLWNTVSALMPEANCQQRWVVKLDRFGFAVSTGSACSSGQEKPSHVLAAMGYGPDQAGRVLRFSSGWETTVEDWNCLEQGLRKVHDAQL